MSWRTYAVGLGSNLERAAEEVEVVHVGRAEIDLERLENTAGRHAEHLGFHAVDIGIELWRRGIERRENPHEAGRSACDRDHALNDAFEFHRPGSGRVLHHHLEATRIADTAHRGGLDRNEAGFRHIRQFRRQSGQQRVDAETAAGPFRKGLEDDERETVSGSIGEGRAVEAGDRDDMRDALDIDQPVGQLRHHRLGSGQRRAGRQLHRGDEIALVQLRDEADRSAFQLPSGQAEQGGIGDQHQHRITKQPPRQRAIARPRACRNPH